MSSTKAYLHLSRGRILAAYGYDETKRLMIAAKKVVATDNGTLIVSTRSGSFIAYHDSNAAERIAVDNFEV